MKKIILLYAALLLLLPSVTMAEKAPSVVVSIKPIHSLVSGVMEGVASPRLLVKGGGSPHGYSLRPSEAQALNRADLIIWVGPELESFLEKPLQTLAKNAQQLELSELLKKALLVKRQGENWEKPAHHHHEEGEHKVPSDNTHNADLHLWLDPALAKQIVSLSAKALMDLDPGHAEIYQGNAEKMLTKLNQLDLHLKQKLAPVKRTPYIVFHAAYQYFESAYGLNAVGSVTIDPERKPGAKKINEIRNKIRELKARCVFSEPQFESRLVATIIEGTGVKTGILDPLGADLPEGPDAYFQLLNRLADNLLEGLK